MKNETGKKLNIVNILMYVLAAGLVCFYVYVLVLSRDTSKVDFSYNEYFFTRRLSHYASVETLKEYMVDEEIIYTTEGRILNQGKGWKMPDTAGCTMSGVEGSFFLYTEAPEKNYELQICAVSVLDDSYDLYIEGKLVGSFSFEPVDDGDTGGYVGGYAGGYIGMCAIDAGSFSNGENYVTIASHNGMKDSLHVYSISCMTKD